MLKHGLQLLNFVLEIGWTEVLIAFEPFSTSLYSVYCELIGDDREDEDDLQEAIKQSLKYYREETQKRYIIIRIIIHVYSSFLIIATANNVW